jgi:hypothetical protein
VLEAVQHGAVSQASELLSADVGLAGLGGRQHAPLGGGDIRQLKIPIRANHHTILSLLTSFGKVDVIFVQSLQLNGGQAAKRPRTTTLTPWTCRHPSDTLNPVTTYVHTGASSVARAHQCDDGNVSDADRVQISYGQVMTPKTSPDSGPDVRCTSGSATHG